MLRSDSITELTKALSAAQGELPGAKKDSKNPYFNSTYADLKSVIDACREPLSKNGLAVAQATSYDAQDRLVLETLLTHSSGEWILSQIRLLGLSGDQDRSQGQDRKQANPMQKMGSALTYARRYGWMTVVGIAPEDDDAQSAGQNIGAQETRQQPATQDRNSAPAKQAPAKQAPAKNDPRKAAFQGLLKSVVAATNAAYAEAAHAAGINTADYAYPFPPGTIVELLYQWAVKERLIKDDGAQKSQSQMLAPLVDVWARKGRAVKDYLDHLAEVRKAEVWPQEPEADPDHQEPEPPSDGEENPDDIM